MYYVYLISSTVLIQYIFIFEQNFSIIQFVFYIISQYQFTKLITSGSSVTFIDSCKFVVIRQLRPILRHEAYKVLHGVLVHTGIYKQIQVCKHYDTLPSKGGHFFMSTFTHYGDLFIDGWQDPRIFFNDISFLKRR